MVAIYFIILIALATLIYYYAQVELQKDALTMAIIVNYTDGTSRRFNQPLSGVLPQTIVDTTGGTVSSLQLELYGTIDYVGTVTSWDFESYLTWDIMEGSTSRYTTGAVKLDVHGDSAPPNKQAFVLTSSTITVSQLESLYSGWTHETEYRLKFLCALPNMELTFSDGATLFKGLVGGTAGYWSFTYQSPNQFNSLSVSWNSVPYY